MLSATQLGTYTKFTPKQEATMLAILSATLANCCTASYRTWDAYAAGDDVNVFCVKLTSRVRPCKTSQTI